METEELLKDIGLTRNETKIYLCLLKLGSVTSGAIIKETRLHTSKVYDSLERLADKGLVTHIIEANVKHFKAVSPNRIIDFLEDKKRKIDAQETEIKKAIPKLVLLQIPGELGTEAEVFKGWKGMETVYSLLRSTLKRGDTNYVFGASKGEDEERVRDFFNKHLVKVAKRRIKQKVIYNEEARGNILEQLKHPNLFQVRYMSNVTPAEINIWADNVMIVILRKQPTVVLIRDRKVADSFVKYFELMWRIAEK